MLSCVQTGKTKLTLEVLRLTVNLIDFGAYEDTTEIKELVGPLVNVLNGVTDVPLPTEKTATVKLSEDRSVAVHPTARYRLNEHTRFVMECKVQMCNVLDKLLDVGLDLRLSRFVKAFTKGKFSEARHESSNLDAVKGALVGGVKAVAGGISAGITTGITYVCVPPSQC